MVSHSGEQIVIGRPRQRAVLGYLLLNAGQLVSTERLIDAVWGERPPATARAQVQADIASIRKALAPQGTDRLATVPAGYRFAADADELDLLRFDAVLTTTVRAPITDPESAATELRAALALWRGRALADVDAPYVPAVRTHLHSRRLEAASPPRPGATCGHPRTGTPRARPGHRGTR
jgi:DNA-binding SARP family transcriptional activator